jgi:Domain of unknown function (DUF2019)
MYNLLVLLCKVPVLAVCERTVFGPDGARAGSYHPSRVWYTILNYADQSFMSKPLKASTTEELVQRFAVKAVEREGFMKAHDPRRASARFDQMVKIYDVLKNRGLDAQRKLLPLLQHKDHHVRYSAAARVVEFDADEAIPILEELSLTGAPLLRFEAKVTLEQWRKGKFRSS